MMVHRLRKSLTDGRGFLGTDCKILALEIFSIQQSPNWYVHLWAKGLLRACNNITRHNQSDTNMIEMVHTRTCTCLRVRAAQHNQSSTNMIKVAHTLTSTCLRVRATLTIKAVQTQSKRRIHGQAPALGSLELGQHSMAQTRHKHSKSGAYTDKHPP